MLPTIHAVNYIDVGDTGMAWLSLSYNMETILENADTLQVEL